MNINLDSPAVFKQYDSQDMLACLHEMPELCQRAWRMAMNFNLPEDYRKINKVVISGMGGSAIGGELVSSLVATEARIPIFISRDYRLPAFVDSETLFMASSYSGMTEETLSAFEQSLNTKAKKLAITTGGKLKAMAEERKVPVFSLDYTAQPRAALAFGFLPILGFVQKLGFLSDKSADVAETVRVLEELAKRINENAALSRNPAKQLAEKLYGRLIAIYGAGLVSAVANRWKTQLNENSKNWAFHEVFPELNHNAIVGYQFPAELASKAAVVLLRSSHLSKRIQLRYEVTCELLGKAKVDYQIVDGEGRSPLSQMMSLVLFGDYASYYLAILNKIDPTPVKNIAYLKEQLAKS
jgi:glucose/mannose-6-phosphate isomerase